MKDNIISSFLEIAELKVLKFDNHRLRAMNYRNRVFQEYYMMTYVRKGSSKLRVGDHIYGIPPGTVIFIPPHLEHDQYKDSDEETEFLWWHFTYKIQNVIDVLPFLQIPYIYPLQNHQKFETVIDEFMLFKTKEGHIPNIILQKAKSLELLYLLLDNSFGRADPADAGRADPADAGQPSPSFLSVLLKIVTQPEASINLADLAKDLHMNPTYVSNHFKELFGKSPILLHREIKIAKAKSLLETGELNITEISGALGFNDVQTFARLFKKHTGISPGQYKGLFESRPV